MKSALGTGLFAAGLFVALSANASPDLAKKVGCTNCHAAAEKKVGPSFKDVAAKYKSSAGAEASIVAKLSAGKDHPQVKASEDDVKKLVKWVLAM